MSKVSIWKNVPGFAGRCNDVLYTYPKIPSTRQFLICFGGDTQDTQDNMEKHEDSRQYVKWCLENVTHTLSERFPEKYIFVVRPSRMLTTRNAVFSCFDNFVSSDRYGIPTFSSTHNSIKHLQKLIESLSERVVPLETSLDAKDKTSCESDEIYITIMGFSKGCVVLNQLLHEFHYFETKSSDLEANKFISSIESMWWLDGGHGGRKDTWITDNNILKSFSNLRINVHVHVTPYQVRDIHRPWIRIEEARFTDTLHKLGVSVKRSLHFEHTSTSRSLLLHFEIFNNI